MSQDMKRLEVLAAEGDEAAQDLLDLHAKRHAPTRCPGPEEICASISGSSRTPGVTGWSLESDMDIWRQPSMDGMTRRHGPLTSNLEIEFGDTKVRLRTIMPDESYIGMEYGTKGTRAAIIFASELTFDPPDLNGPEAMALEKEIAECQGQLTKLMKRKVAMIMSRALAMRERSQE